METSLRAIKSSRRTRLWIETSTDILKYVGYISLGIITIYSFYKIGVFNWIKRLMPGNLCIKLFCVFTTVNTTPTAYYTLVATAHQMKIIIYQYKVQ